MSSQTRSSRDLITPLAMRALPAEALTDLRRRFAYLEAIFHVPDVDLAAAWDATPTYLPPAPVGHMAARIPTLSTPPPAPTAMMEPDLLRHGFTHMMAMIRA